MSTISDSSEFSSGGTGVKLESRIDGAELDSGNGPDHRWLAQKSVLKCQLVTLGTIECPR